MRRPSYSHEELKFLAEYVKRCRRRGVWMSEIANALNKDMVPNFMSRVGLWKPTTVRAFLQQYG